MTSFMLLFMSLKCYFINILIVPGNIFKCSTFLKSRLAASLFRLHEVVQKLSLVYITIYFSMRFHARI